MSCVRIRNQEIRTDPGGLPFSPPPARLVFGPGRDVVAGGEAFHQASARSPAGGSGPSRDNRARLARASPATDRPRRAEGGVGTACTWLWSTSMRAPIEDRSGGQEEVGHGPQRVEVAARIRRPAVLDRLGSEVVKRAGEDVLARQPRPSSGMLTSLTRPKSSDLGEVRDAAELRQQDVGRLDVAVDEPDAHAPRRAPRRPVEGCARRAREAEARPRARGARGRCRRGTPSRSRTRPRACARSRRRTRCEGSSAARSAAPPARSAADSPRRRSAGRAA